MEAATAQKTARFISKGRNYRAILLTPHDHPHPLTAQRVVDQAGFTAEFARSPFDDQPHESDGSFQWPPEASDPYAPHVREDGIYVDPQSGAEVDVIERLRTHPDNGIFFFELGLSPEEALEAQRQKQAEIARAIAARDTDRLAEIYAEEEDGLKREPILTAALEAMKAIEETEPEGSG